MEKDFIIIKEKIEAPKIIIKKENNELKFYKKYNKEITILDRTLISLYEYPIKYFSNLDISLFEENKYYYFNYLYNNKPVNTEYKIPKNNLILVNIIDSSNNYYDINNYNLFGTDVQNYIKLDSSINIEQIKESTFDIFLKNNNIEYKHILENNIIKSLIILTINNNKIVNNINYTFNKEKAIRTVTDSNSIILKDILKYVNKIDFNKVEFIHNSNKDIRYINFIYSIYKNYKTDININILDIFKNPVFNLNLEFINDIGEIENIELFKFMLNLFRKDKYINSSFFNLTDLKILKNAIYNINKVINIEKEIANNDLFQFKTYKEYIKNN